jgi:hypothetical protein
VKQLAEQDNRWEKDEQRWSELIAASHSGDIASYAQLLNELTEALTAYL